MRDDDEGEERNALLDKPWEQRAHNAWSRGRSHRNTRPEEEAANLIQMQQVPPRKLDALRQTSRG